MLEFLYRVFIGHNHKWDIIQTIAKVDDNDLPIASIKVLQCEFCGNIKQVTIQ